jgi:hypothetical protein
VDVFFAYDEGASRQEVFAVMAELRGGGLACEAEYAGRSLKGQMTQASRLRARHVVVVSAGGAMIRREGQELTAAPVPVREIGALLLGHPGPPPAFERTDETRARVSEAVPTSEPKSG